MAKYALYVPLKAKPRCLEDKESPMAAGETANQATLATFSPCHPDRSEA
jgi:hypothetical protein